MMEQIVIDQKNSLDARLGTGLPGLDTLLNGGFIKGDTYLFMGPPGSGKTILGSQICFHHAKEGSGNVVFVTLLAESHSRLIRNIKKFDYFDEKILGESVFYYSAYESLEKDGLKGLLSQLAQIVREKKACLLMVDGMTTVNDFDSSGLAFRKFVHAFNAVMSTSGCTGILLSSNSEKSASPEHTMVDGILAFHHKSEGLRSFRQIEVRKFRGSEHLEGNHFLSINKSGARVIPRIEALTATFRFPESSKSERLAFGIPGIDEMLGGGVASNSITTLIGAAGTGKTILGLHFLQAGAKKGEKGLFFGFYEAPHDLLEKCRSLKLDVKASVEKGMIEIMWHPALEQELDELGNSLIDAVKKSNVKRVVIDGVDGFRYSATHQKRINRFFVALVMKLKSDGATVVLAEETSLFSRRNHRQVAELAALNETLLFLRHIDLGSKMVRVISILKVRSAVYDSSVREFRINQNGVEVLGAVMDSKNENVT